MTLKKFRPKLTNPIESNILRSGRVWAIEIQDFLLFSLLGAGRRLGKYLKDKMPLVFHASVYQRTAVVVDLLDNKPVYYGD